MDVTKIVDLIYSVKQNGIDIILNGEQLQLKVPDGIKIEQNLLEEIKNNKQLIIDFLKSDNWQSKGFDKTQNKINKADRSNNHFHLSFSQERLWFIHKLEGSVQYHVPAVWHLKGELNKEALQKALQKIIDRHEVLRTVYKEEDGTPYQFINESLGWQLSIVDAEKIYQSTKALPQYIKELINKPFELSRDYMLRASLITISEAEYQLVITMHHIATDAWSFPIIIKELIELYSSYVSGSPSNLSQLSIQYADYALWQRSYLSDEALERKTNYWKKKLEDITPLQLPTDYARPPIKGVKGNSVEFNLNKELSDQLQTFCSRQEATLFMTLLAAFNVLLYRYSGQEDICVGTSIANRNQKEIEELIGFFVNTLALRNQVKSNESFIELLQQVRDTTMEAYENQDVPLEKLVEMVVKERDSSRNPLFQVMLVMQNASKAQQLYLGDVQLSFDEFENNTAKFDITFFIKETPDGFQGNVHYATDLYKEETINRMVGHFKTLLDAIVKSPHKKIAELEILTAQEKQQLLYEFNYSKVEYPKDKSIVDLFEKQADSKPNSIAVVFGEQKLTYLELNEKANRIAHYLREKGIKEETPIPIFIERSIDMIVGILGILKAGAAYVPIDVEFPKERISYMLKDSTAQVIVTNKSSKIYLPELANIDIVEIDSDSSAINFQPTTNLQNKVLPHHLAYVIYTSGSTGKPKGVMIEHRNLVDYIFGLAQKIHIDKCSSYALVSTIATDLGNTVIFSSLVFGGTLHLFSKEIVSNAENIQRYFKDNTIDCLKIVPSHWKALSDYNHLLLPAKLLLFGGESLSSKVVENIQSSNATCKVINHYGPTETTIGKLLHIVNKDREYNDSVPIGRPFSNTSVYVLNKDMALCPVGVPGQLFIEGDGIARGYFNHPELTKEKFIENPFNDHKSFMYTTGDLVKYLPDGEIEFIGRVDDQVKIRGFRIELGEIQATLQQCDAVAHCVVIALESDNGNKQVVAYVVPSASFDREYIITYLKNNLPDYMVPAHLVEIDHIPLTLNGKIDRKALPDPDMNELYKDQYIAPTNKMEERLVKIWQDVLEVESVGIHDNFFNLGGHSLLAVRLISAIRKEFEVEMPIGEIFDYPTIASLSSQSLSKLESNLLPSLKVVTPRPLLIPLSFSQERLWFIDQLEGSVQYHRPALWNLKGDLNKNALGNALQNTINRHEVLRTVILSKEGMPYQFVKDAKEWELEFIDTALFNNDDKQLQKHIKDLIREPFDLSKDFMIRAHLFSLGNNEYKLLITMHHIASDGWSTSIFVSELMELYNAYVEDRPGQLLTLPVQYADYSIWQRDYLQGEVLDKKANYWKNKLQDLEALELPTDHQRPVEWSHRGGSLEFNLDKQMLDQLQVLSKNEGATLFMTLLAALNVLLYRYSGQKDICIGSPIANRTQKETEGLIGFFLNTLALRSEVNSGSSFKEFLQQVRTTTMEAYEHHDLPFEKVVELVVKERDLSRNPLFQVMLVMRNTPEVPELNLGKVSLSAEDQVILTALFDITLSITETANGLQCVISYAADLYNEETIIRMIGHFKTLLNSIVTTSSQKIGELKMLTEEEQHQLLIEFNNTKVDHPKNRTIIDLFEEQAAKLPEATALIFKNEKLTYRELNEKANQLAHALRKRGVKEETLIPVCIENNMEMVIGILGILKAGGAYVPIDPEFPQERIGYILKDINATIIISTTKSKIKLPGINNFEIIDLQNGDLFKESIENLNTNIIPDNLAYVIYTSGSTGRPKGVMVEHKNLLNYLINNQTKYINDTANTSGTFIHLSYTFDASLTGIFLPLLNGKSVVISSKQSIDVFDDINFEKHSPYDFIKITPSHLEFLQTKFDLNNENLLTERLVIGGESLYASQLNEIIEKELEVQIINEYGPTETTVGCSTYSFDTLPNHKIISNTISIGKPIDNTKIYILDSDNMLLPVGVPGEIHVGGIQVSRGYLNLPQLTKEKFIENSFVKESKESIYKTGDIGRWLPDGNIEYLGRKDDQVKIRGYRIELGEIENVLAQCKQVSQGVVLAKDDNNGSKHLVGFVVPKGIFDKEAIVSYLRNILPEYMVPAMWVELDSIPLTVNGKIDRKILPELSEQTTKQYVAARNEVEEKLVYIWQNLLGAKKVSVFDNFFELGGHSLLAMRVISAIRKELNVELEIKDLFRYTTISDLSAYIEANCDFEEFDANSYEEIKI